VKNTKTFTSVFTITLLLSLVIFTTNTSSGSPPIISLGREKSLKIELSPKQPLFNPKEDGYFYPGSPKITKKLIVRNVGDVPFRICHFNATFYNDTQLAKGLQMEILELGKGKGEKPNLLYNGTLNSLSQGVEVEGKRAIPKGESDTLQITVWMPETAGNEYQGLSLTADIAITVRFPPAHDSGNS